MSDGPGDEQLLIDFVLDRCDAPTVREVRRRLGSEPDLARLHADIAATFAALGRLESPEPAGNLVERTLARVEAMRRTEALATTAPVRRGFWPTFSLREVGALAAAAVIVAGILIPALLHARRLSDRNLCQANLGQIGAALNHYANENSDTFPASPVGEGSWLARPGRPRASNSAALFLLARSTLAEPEVFQCPAAGGKSFVVQAGQTDFPSPQSIGYSYQHSLGRAIRRSQPELAAVMEQLAVAVDSTPVFRKGQFRPEWVNRTVSDNHADGGQNVLYLPGHVKWTTDCRVGVGGNNIFLADGIFDYAGEEKPVSATDTFCLPNCWP